MPAPMPPARGRTGTAFHVEHGFAGPVRWVLAALILAGLGCGAPQGPRIESRVRRAYGRKLERVWLLAGAPGPGDAALPGILPGLLGDGLRERGVRVFVHSLPGEAVPGSLPPGLRERAGFLPGHVLWVAPGPSALKLVLQEFEGGFQVWTASVDPLREPRFSFGIGAGSGPLHQPPAFEAAPGDLFSPGSSPQSVADGILGRLEKDGLLAPPAILP